MDIEAHGVHLHKYFPTKSNMHGNYSLNEEKNNCKEKKE